MKIKDERTDWAWFALWLRDFCTVKLFNVCRWEGRVSRYVNGTIGTIYSRCDNRQRPALLVSISVLSLKL